jgi:hypothetical protein
MIRRGSWLPLFFPERGEPFFLEARFPEFRGELNMTPAMINERFRVLKQADMLMNRYKQSTDKVIFAILLS